MSSSPRYGAAGVGSYQPAYNAGTTSPRIATASASPPMPSAWQQQASGSMSPSIPPTKPGGNWNMDVRTKPSSYGYTGAAPSNGMSNGNWSNGSNGNMSHGTYTHTASNGSWKTQFSPKSNGNWSNGSNGNMSNGNMSNGNSGYSNGSNGNTGSLSPRRTDLGTNIGYNPAGYETKAGEDRSDLLFVICEKEVNPSNETMAGREEFGRQIKGADYEGGKKIIVYLKPTMDQWEQIAKLLSGREELMVLKRAKQLGSGFGMEKEFFGIKKEREMAPPGLQQVLEGKIGSVNPKKIGYLPAKTIYVPVKVAYQSSSIRSPLSARGSLQSTSSFSASPYVLPGQQVATSSLSSRPASPVGISAGRTTSARLSPRSQSVYFPTSAAI